MQCRDNLLAALPNRETGVDSRRLCLGDPLLGCLECIISGSSRCYRLFMPFNTIKIVPRELTILDLDKSLAELLPVEDDGPGTIRDGLLDRRSAAHCIEDD